MERWRGLAAALFCAGLLRAALAAPAAPAAATPAPAAPPASAAELLSAAPPGYAYLVSGPEAVKGLPFFSVNALPALRGDYLARGRELRVWSSRSPLVFGAEWAPLDWPEFRASGFRPLARGAKEGGAPVLALAAARYTLFLEPPGEAAAWRSFALAFARRFAFFFENAPTDAELSFPAWIELPRS